MFPQHLENTFLRLQLFSCFSLDFGQLFCWKSPNPFKGPVPNRYNRFAPNREIQSKVPKSSSKRFKLTHNSSEMHREAFVVSGRVTKCVLWVPLTAISIENEPKSLMMWHLDRFDTGRNHDIDFRALDGMEKSKSRKTHSAHRPGCAYST